jgi:phosphoglycolate phosphatase-like HAD superfamily hydrolase
MKNIKAIIFDFDGVIVESTGIKTEAFRQLFSLWPEHQDHMVNYHVQNMGVSRFDKFSYFYAEVLNKELTFEIKQQLSDEFSKLVYEKVIAAPFVLGVEKFLSDNEHKYKYFIASATPEKELLLIAKMKGIDRYFEEIGGTPRTKATIAKCAMENSNLSQDEVVFIGDAEGDRLAAAEVGIPFIARLTKENSFFDSCEYRINDFNEMEDCLSRFNC